MIPFRTKDPFRDIRDTQRKQQHALSRVHLWEQRRLRRHFHEWSPLCKRILHSLGSMHSRKPSLFQRLLIFFFGGHDRFWYMMRKRIYRVAVDRTKCAWYLYTEGSTDHWLSYDQFLDQARYDAYVTIAFNTDPHSVPCGFRVTIGADNNSYATELSEQALVDLFRRHVIESASAADN